MIWKEAIIINNLEEAFGEDVKKNIIIVVTNSDKCFNDDCDDDFNDYQNKGYTFVKWANNDQNNMPRSNEYMDQMLQFADKI